MGLVILKTCAKCNKTSSPLRFASGLNKYTSVCRHCGHDKFLKEREPQHKIKCHLCGHEYVFNDVGCPNCVTKEIKLQQRLQ